MKFSKFFIQHPIFATVLAILFVVAGLVTLPLLPIAQYPDITPPTVQVAATYPGANAETVAQTVGIPIEQQVNGVDGMIYMNSTSSSDGSYALTVTFEVGTDIDMATILVQNRVNVALNTLPDAVKQQGVTVTKQSSNIVMFLTLSGDSIYNGLYLSNFAQLNLVDQLLRVPGVGAVNVMGAGNYSMRVWLDPDAMRIRSLTPQQVYQAIAAQNMEVSAGYVGQQLGKNTGGMNAFQYTLDVKGRLTSPEEFGNIVLRVERNGAMLRLRDVARVDQGSISYSVSSRLNGKPTAAIGIYQLPGSNSLDVARGVRQRMTELAQTFPAGVHYQVTLDTTEVVRSSIVEVLRTFGEATLLVVLVIFLFLQNWRAVLIPCISIPVSLIGTLAAMELFGFSINLLTLFGLVLAIAIVVDDAIVVVENATRLLDTGKYQPREAVTHAMDEITGPVVGVVLVLLAVFIPTTLISGISGEMFKQFALTISVSTVISGFNSLTLTPALCALFLRPQSGKRTAFKLFNDGYDAVQRAYDATVNRLLRHPVISIASFLLLSVSAVGLFMRWPTTFIPEEDDGYFMVAVQLPPASSLPRTEQTCTELVHILGGYEEVKNTISMAGFSIMAGSSQSNMATLFVMLTDWSQRKGLMHSAAAVVERFNKQAYLQVPQAQVFAMVPPAIPGLGRGGGLQLELEDRNNLGNVEMQKAVDALIASFATHPSLADISSTYEANVPQYYLNIDRDKAQTFGLNMSNVFATLSYYMGQAYVNDYVLFGRIFQVRLSAGDQAQKRIGDVLKLSVANAQGEMVPFSSFVTLEERLGMNQISRYNLYNAAAVSINVAPGYSSSEAIDATQELIAEQLGNQFGDEWTAVAYQELNASGSTALIFLMALFVVYLVLAAQYESWTSPVAAVMGVPIALLGAVVGCWLFGIPISIYTQIGIVLLIALSAKNGILIVEFARDYRAAGNDIRESAYQAGHVRLRPILMTSFAFVLGVLPLLFAGGAGAASRLSLGAAVVFGMLFNTLFATLYIPNWYEWMQTLQERVHIKNKPLKNKEV